jgi:hypothetical protein
VAHMLSDVGPSDELRDLVSKVDIENTTIPVVLDKPRTLQVVNKNYGHTELIVRCRDDEVTVVLHLPYAADARAIAVIISYKG